MTCSELDTFIVEELRQEPKAPRSHLSIFLLKHPQPRGKEFMQDFLYHFMGVSGTCVYSVDLSRAFVCVKEWEEVSLSLSERTSLSIPF